MANPPPKAKTTSVVVPSKRKMTALTAKEVAGDRSVGDFVKWIENFGTNKTGHFTDSKSCSVFALMMRGMVESPQFKGYLEAKDAHLLEVQIKGLDQECPGMFTSSEAAADFCRQALEYLEHDEFIGVKPSGTTEDKPSSGPARKRTANNGKVRRRRKTPGSSR